MTVNEILSQLSELGNDDTKKILIKHGAKEPFFGVKVADLKTIQKKTKKNHELSLELYETGNSDAMYLAGMIADEKKITKEQLQDWIEKAYWYYLSEFAVSNVCAETEFGFDLALEWINSNKENIAAAGWSTISSIISVKPSNEIDLQIIADLLDRAKNNIKTAEGRIKYTMNGFTIAVGTFIESLSDKAIETSKTFGKVEVDFNGTSCKVPNANEYINKVKSKGNIGKKRKKVRS